MNANDPPPSAVYGWLISVMIMPVVPVGTLVTTWPAGSIAHVGPSPYPGVVTLAGDVGRLKEALGKQQKVNLRRVGPRGEVLDVADGAIHVAEDLLRLARTDPHHATLQGRVSIISNPDQLR